MDVCSSKKNFKEMLNLYDKISLVIYQISCHQDYSKDFFFLLTLNFTQ